MMEDNTRENIKENVEQFLNLYPIDEDRPGDPNLRLEPDTHGGLIIVIIEVPGDEANEGSTYRVQVCPICGETQAANFEAFKKHSPDMAENLVKKRRKKHAQEYVETGKKPPEEDVVKNRVEREVADWDNHRCEQSHPPRELKL